MAYASLLHHFCIKIYNLPKFLIKFHYSFHSQNILHTIFTVFFNDFNNFYNVKIKYTYNRT